MPNILIENNFYQGTSQACIVDVTPPVFSGIVSATVQSRGQIRASWAVATDSTPPIRYEVYIQASTATGLFSTSNIIAITDKLQYDTFTMPNGSFLVNGTTYYVGVRAIDGVSNRDSNTVSISVISTGVNISADIYSAEGAFAINTSNQLQGTLWCLKNSILAKTGNAVMGTASYQVYDKTGTAVPGMGAGGISADSNGQYKIVPVASSLSTSLDHYMVKITINVDGADREGYEALIEPIPQYNIMGSFAVNHSNNVIGSFWVSSDGDQVDNLARLGTGSYQIKDSLGNNVIGLSQSGIVANADGQYIITPVTNILDLSASIYYVHLSVVVDNILREEIVPLNYSVPEYSVKAQFSITGANQLIATFWVTSDESVKTTSLGVANYTVYDASGVAVAGLTQSGITADVNGRYNITPVSAVLLTDLTHYNVKIGIVADGVERISYKGFTLLGT